MLYFTISVGKSRHWNAGENALNVETAGYALLTQVILKNIGYGGPIVTYLTNQRKGGVGFVSTQVCYRHEKFKKVIRSFVTSEASISIITHVLIYEKGLN